MPGLGWDLNLDPDQQAVARRLSFSDADSAELLRASRPTRRNRHPTRRYIRSPSRRQPLPRIPEDAEEQAADTPIHPPQRTEPPSMPATTSGMPYPGRGEMPCPTSAPVATPLVPAPSEPLQPQQPQEVVVAAARMLEHQRQLQAAQQQQAWAAGLQQQASAAARLWSRLLRLYTVGGGPAGYGTKWGELHPASQRLLLRIEAKLREYKCESQQLDQCICLHNPSLYNKSFELDANQIMQEVESTSIIIDREKVSIEGLTDVVKEMMWNTDISLHSYIKQRPRFVQRGAGSAAGYANHPGPSGGHTEFDQRLTKAPTFCCYSGAPRCPSPFIEFTIARFEELIGECSKWVVELEGLIQMKDDSKTFPESLESLSKVLSNVHDYFIHVASKVEDLHQTVETIKTWYLNDRRCRGDWNDPFVEADKKESARQKVLLQ